jgi:hypothetical protein
VGGAIVGTTGTAAAAAASAAISSLSAQITTQLTLGILAQQSPGDILNKILSVDTLKSTVTSTISAGALYELGGLQNAADTCKLVRNVENAGVQAGIGIGADIAFGQKNLEDALKSGGVQFVSQAAGSSIAGEIGVHFKDKSGAMDRCLHKVAHGVAAGGIAAGGAGLLGQDVGVAAAGAAAGAVTAEIVADILSQPLNQDVTAEVVKQEAELGRKLTPQEKEVIFYSKVENISQFPNSVERSLAYWQAVPMD